MLVRECLRNAPITVPPECTLEEAAGLMGQHGVGCLLVASGGELLGIVTDRDIVLRGVSTGQSLHAHIATVMSEHPTVIQGSADIFEAIKAPVSYTHLDVYKRQSSHRRIVVGIDDSRDSTRAIGPCLYNYGRRGSGQASVVLDS